MTIALLDHSTLLRSRRGSDRHHGVVGDQPRAIHPWARGELGDAAGRDLPDDCRSRGRNLIVTKLLAAPVIADKTDLEILALSPTPDSVYADSGPGAGTTHRTPLCTERLHPLVELIEGAEDMA